MLDGLVIDSATDGQQFGVGRPEFLEVAGIGNSGRLPTVNTRAISSLRSTPSRTANSAPIRVAVAIIRSAVRAPSGTRSRAAP
jgi:hypothetical protein